MEYYIGWDVGAWQCRSSGTSCDAIVILNEEGCLGHYRNSLSGTIQQLLDYKEDDADLFLVDCWRKLCEIKTELSTEDKFVMAIDTPLGWPKDFVALINGEGVSERWKLPAPRKDIDNTLLHRRTERNLGASLSAITQQIGSQSTKGMALLDALNAVRQSWGVWTVNSRLTLVETYPACCLRSGSFVRWMQSQAANTHDHDEELRDDTFDAYVCAFVAKAFAIEPSLLKPPPSEDTDQEIDEGWIFHPNGNLVSHQLLYGKGGLVESETSFVGGLNRVQEQVVSSLLEVKAESVDDWKVSKAS